MRRLPIYLLLDTSNTMAVHAWFHMESALGQLLQTIWSDPQLLETAWISWIGCGDAARVLLPLTEAHALYEPGLPKLPAAEGGVADMRAGLRVLDERVGEEWQETSGIHKGDYKPVVFAFTASPWNVDADDVAASPLRNPSSDSLIVVDWSAEPQQIPSPFIQIRACDTDDLDFRLRRFLTALWTS